MTGQEILKYPFVLMAAFLVTYLLTPAVRRVALRLGVVDKPDERRPHLQATPRGGGVAVFLGFHAGCAALFMLPWLPFSGTISVEWWWHFLLVSSLLLAVGLADDVMQVGPWAKLAGQLAVSVLAFAMDMRVGRVFDFPLPPVVDLILTVLWFLAIINAFNLIDGLDGLATGLAILAAFGLAGSFMLRRSPGDVLVLLGLVGACLAFLRYNFHPASIFLGDSGSMFLGLALAAVSLETAAKGTALAAIGIPFLALGVPILDTVLAVWRRTVRRYAAAGGVASAGAKVFGADTDHLHHRLVRSGMSIRRVAVVLYGVSAVLVAVGLMSLAFQSRALGIYLVAFVGASYVVVRHLAHVELWDSGMAIMKRMRQPSVGLFSTVLYPLLDVVVLAVALLVAVGIAGVGSDPAGLKDRWFRLLPIWLTVPFLAAWFGGAYRCVWSRARVSEYFVLAVSLMGGALVAGGVTHIAGAYSARGALTMAVVFGCLTVLTTCGMRAFPRFVEDWTSWYRRVRGRAQGEAVGVVVFGAGAACTLFLRSRAAGGQGDGRERIVVGLVDDDVHLHGRYVFGYRVLGGMDVLIRQIEEGRVGEVVLTESMDDERRKELMKVAGAHGCRVMEWRAELVAG